MTIAEAGAPAELSPARAGTYQPRHDPPEPRRGKPGWIPGIRSVVALVVLLPLLTISVISGAGVAGSLANRVNAQTVERDVTTLQAVTQDRLTYDRAATPIIVYGGANAVGLTTEQTDAILNAEAVGEVPTQEQATSLLDHVGAFRTSKQFADDKTRNLQLLARMRSNPFSVTDAVATIAKTGDDINTLWMSDFVTVEKDVRELQGSGTTALDIATLRQVWIALNAGVYQAYEVPMVPAGLGATPINGVAIGIDLEARTAVFNSATAAFDTDLQSGAERVWRQLQADKDIAAFRQVLQTSLTEVAGGIPAKATVSVLTTASQIRGSLTYITLLGSLVNAADSDIRAQVAGLVIGTTNDLIRLTVILVGVIAISVAGVIVSGSVLTKPIRALERAALRVYQGDFDVRSLGPAGPREVRTATAAFNDMASTLKAVEATAMALADEDITRSELQTRLPGRTGRALQAAVDQLTNSIEARELARQERYETATHDRLTRLPNRLHFQDRALHTLFLSQRNRSTVALLFLDLDNFREINSRYGHSIGDAALCTVADRLRALLREPDMVARFTSDEFGIMLESTLADNTPASVAKQIVLEISKPMVIEGQVLSVTASVGMALGDDQTDFESMLSHAYEVTRHVKITGKARYAIYGDRGP